MLMRSLATTTVTILRGTADDYTGEISNEETVASRVPASLVENAPTVEERADGRPRSIRTAALRLPGHTDLAREDRVRDDQTGDLWTVVELYQPTHPAVVLDVHARVTRTTA